MNIVELAKRAREMSNADLKNTLQQIGVPTWNLRNKDLLVGALEKAAAEAAADAVVDREAVATADQSERVETPAETAEKPLQGPRRRGKGVVCEHCGSRNTRVTHTRNQRYPQFLNIRKRYYLCGDCGKRTQEETEL